MADNSKFDHFYSDVLQELIQSLETKRKQTKNLSVAGILTGIFAGIFFLISMKGGAANPDADMFITVVCVAAAIIIYFIYQQKKKVYIADFKQTIIRKIVAYIDPSFKYDFSSVISSADYQKSGLFLQEYNKYEGGDYVEGKSGKTFFSFSELHTQYLESSGKSSHWVTIFKGLFFIADFNKNFSSRTYVWSENAPQLNFFSKLFSSFAKHLEEVNLESPEFEKRFIVYSDDQVESRYILTPTMMEKMIYLQDIFRKDLVFSFVDTNVYVAIPFQEDLFEPSVFNAPGEEEMANYYNTVQTTLELIDELDLNLRIWTKK